MSYRIRSLERFSQVVAVALAHLEARREEINDLNVFPVADGDTGDNMVLTMRAIHERLVELNDAVGTADLSAYGRKRIVDEVTEAALMGGRGNSGVILSQLVRGAAEVMINDETRVDPKMLAEAMGQAARRAREAIQNPQEGTILTVISSMADRLQGEVEQRGDAATLARDAAEEEQDRALAELLSVAVVAGERSVQDGPDLLPVLREFGVVDAGGYGLVVLIAGAVAALQGQAPEVAHYKAPSVRPSAASHASTSFRYCINFIVTGEDLEPDRFESELSAIGDSVLVVGSPTMLRVHVHADDPSVAREVFDGHGLIGAMEFTDMVEQVDDRARRLAGARSLVLAIVSGPRMRELFELDRSAVVLDSGDALNPSAGEIVEALSSVSVDEVVILTGSPNVELAARAAAEKSDRTVEVLVTDTVQEGLLLLMHHDRSLSAEENLAAMSTAREDILTAGLAVAARDDAEGRFSIGDSIGYVDGELVAWGAPEDVLADVLSRLPESSAPVVIESSMAPVPVLPSLEAHQGLEAFEHHLAEHPGWWCLIATD